ncbi:MAG: hypothetical protein KJZ64_09175 [Sphingomonadaceae bacterium]|nr:hypothetical protein [Sphingomonadaceae bacterium]
MANDPPMPTALQVAEAIAKVLGTKLADLSAERIDLDREEAALCLGLAEGVIESLKAEGDVAGSA